MRVKDCQFRRRVRRVGADGKKHYHYGCLHPWRVHSSLCPFHGNASAHKCPYWVENRQGLLQFAKTPSEPRSEKQGSTVSKEVENVC